MARIDSRSLKLMGAGMAVAVASTLTLTAFAGDPAGGPGWRHHEGMGMHQRGGPEMGGGMHMFGGERLDRMLDDAGATDAQRAQIKQIAKAAAEDLKALHEAARKLRDQAMDIFTAPQIDAAAVEKLRQQQLAQHDQVSKRVTQAMLDIARVLTPEQRAKLAAHFTERQQRMMRGGRDGAGDGASGAVRGPRDRK